MASSAGVQSTFSANLSCTAYPETKKLFKSQYTLHGSTLPRVVKHSHLWCTKFSAWEPSSVPYAPNDDNLLKANTNIFDTLKSDTTMDTAVMKKDEPSMQVLKWPMWLLGPSLLLVTGMGPTLWLPLSSIFLGPNIASLLSLIGLDCIFNLGALLFLLIADTCARPQNPNQVCISKAPFSYRFWNMFGNLTGFIIPLAIFFISHKGYLQQTQQLPFISFAILLGPYLLLLFVQMLTEMLTWHWNSPVWLVTPVIYEAYRVLQLMRGLKLGAELSVPVWTVHTIRGLVCWWVLILGIQLMRVAWFAGFTARGGEKKDAPASVVDNA